MNKLLSTAPLALILLGFVSQADAAQGKSTPVTRSNISNNRTCEPGATGEDCDDAAAVSAPRDAASGQATGKRQHGEVKIVKELDKSSAPVEAGTGTESEGCCPGRCCPPGAQENSVKSPRDAASGQASGKRVATGDVTGDGASDATAQPQEYKAKAGKTGSAK